jgi:predicted metal-dependent hydrolase
MCVALSDQLALFAPSLFGGQPDESTTTGRLRRLVLEGEVFEWTLTRSHRKTVGMIVSQGRIVVRAPRWVTIEEIERILQSKSRWLCARMREWRSLEAARIAPEVQWADGGCVEFLGCTVTIRLNPSLRQVHWNEPARELGLALSPQSSPEQVKDRVEGWLQQQAKRILQERLERLATEAGLRFQSFAISHAKTRWGSCTQDGVIRLNWRLVRFSLPVIDYVVAHELAHLRAMDHSPDFWQEVAKILPSFEEGRSQIKGVALEP